jgi:hypothetical protein
VANKKADHYRAMAERRLADANQVKNPIAKILLLEIAGRYEALAEVSGRAKNTD